MPKLVIELLLKSAQSTLHFTLEGGGLTHESS